MSQPETKRYPTEIKLHAKSKVLEVAFDSGDRFEMPCEFLRVYSPSAEVQGHGPGQEVLQFGKKEVNIDSIEPVGQYAVKLIFDDGHDSGIYSWNILYNLGKHYADLWQEYLTKLEQAGRSREPQGQSSLAKQPKGCS